MNNEQIIAKTAMASGIMTSDEIAEYLNNGKEIPLHTLQGWALRGYRVKKGEHGIATQLWKKKTKKKGTAEMQDDSTEVTASTGFYLTRAYLFQESQCVPAEQKEV